jgi:hypothetical protein
VRAEARATNGLRLLVGVLFVVLLASLAALDVATR